MICNRFKPLFAICALIAASGSFSGCDGCSKTNESRTATATTTAASGQGSGGEHIKNSAKTPGTQENSADNKAAAATQKTATAAVKVVSDEAEPYSGPTSTNPTGYTITTGFSNEKGDAISQPSALEKTTSYITVLGPNNGPMAVFDTFHGAEMHAFLLARDMRHAFYKATTGPVVEGADARKVMFAPREGGDHALIVVFKPVGKSAQAVSTPVVFKRALPKIAGPGVTGLSDRSRVHGGDVRLVITPKLPKVGETITFTAQRLDNTGHSKGTERLKFMALLNDKMGGGEVVVFSAAGSAQWTPSAAGTWLAVAPPEEGATPLTFKVVVAEAKEPAAAAEQ